MRIVKNYQTAFDQIAIEDIPIDASSRDDIPAVLKGIQHVYRDLKVRERLFALLQEHLLQPAGSATAAADGKLNPALGRPGMELWSILVLALLKQGINCDFDRLAELANKHLDVRRMLGLSDTFCDWHFCYRTLVRNVSLLTPDLLAAVNRLVVEAGLRLVGHAAEEPLRARADSFVVETNVHYPTDVSLLWDALRCLLRVLPAACLECGVPGWRQSAHLLEEARKLFQRVRAARQRKGRKGRRKVKAYLRMARLLVARAEQSLAQLAAAGAPQAVREEVEGYVGHARRQIDQIDRRVLQGQRIPHEEKVFSIFEPHTRWCAKGEAGVAVELGVPVSVVECEQQFVLHWS